MNRLFIDPQSQLIINFSCLGPGAMHLQLLGPAQGTPSHLVGHKVRVPREASRGPQGVPNKHVIHLPPLTGRLIPSPHVGQAVEVWTATSARSQALALSSLDD